MNLRRKKGSCSSRMHSLPREKRTQRDRERPPRRQRRTGARIPPSLYRRVNEGHLKRGGAAEIERERRRKPGPKKLRSFWFHGCLLVRLLFLFSLAVNRQAQSLRAGKSPALSLSLSALIYGPNRRSCLLLTIKGEGWVGDDGLRRYELRKKGQSEGGRDSCEGSCGEKALLSRQREVFKTEEEEEYNARDLFFAQVHRMQKAFSENRLSAPTPSFAALPHRFHPSAQKPHSSGGGGGGGPFLTAPGGDTHTHTHKSLKSNISTRQ